MGYTIQYGQRPKMEVKMRAVTRRHKIRTAVLAAIFAFGLYLSFTEGFASLGELLIPGDKEVTKAAFSQMTERIREGEGFGDSITAFCREIISSARESNKDTN